MHHRQYEVAGVLHGHSARSLDAKGARCDLRDTKAGQRKSVCTEVERVLDCLDLEVPDTSAEHFPIRRQTLPRRQTPGREPDRRKPVRRQSHGVRSESKGRALSVEPRPVACLLSRRAKEFRLSEATALATGIETIVSRRAAERFDHVFVSGGTKLL